MATDSLQERQLPAWWQRFLMRKDTDFEADFSARGSRHELLNLLTEIGQQVESTLVVDRETGFSFDQYLRRV